MSNEKTQIDNASFSGQTVLVTGGSGFIGSALCRRLVSEDAEVHAISRTDRAGGNLRWWKSDLGDYSKLKKLVTALRPKVIYHLAGKSSGVRELDMVAACFHANLATSVNVLTAATETGCERVILAGSMEEPDADDDNAIPSSPYAVSKWAASAYARMFSTLYQTPVVNLRVFMTYGPGREDTRKLIPHVTLSLLRNKPPAISSGRRSIDWIFIDDLIDGMLAAARAPKLIGRTVDLGSGTAISIRELVLELARIIPTKAKPMFGAAPDRPFEQTRIANTGDAYAKLKWTPRVPLTEGLMRTVDWYSQRLQDGKFAE